jgi:hypothetical protein
MPAKSAFGDPPTQCHCRAAARITRAAISVTVGVAIVVAGVAIWTSTTMAQTLPADAQPTATVSSDTFASWFVSGKVALNGAVKPADSIKFPNPDHGAVNQAFYQWAEQMFLWLTSPSPKQVGDDGRVFNSPIFYTVSTPDETTGKRKLRQNAGGSNPVLALRAAKPGGNGLPIVADKAGSLFELEPTARAGDRTPVVLNKAGEKIKVGKVTPEGLEDLNGKLIPAPRPIIDLKFRDSAVVQKFTSADLKINLYLDKSGNTIDVSSGQGDTFGVLLTQSGSPVYYMISVNDVYAYFRTAHPGKPASELYFPRCQHELDPIVAFASARKITFSDANALCVEVKTSWVEADQLPENGCRHITMVGQVPNYDRTNPKHWVAKGTKCVRLALVGMHIAGSACGHSEMIWATFEHFGNSPNCTYAYNSIKGPNPTTVRGDTSGTWLFCGSGATIFNRQRQSASGADIVSIATIMPTDTIRFKPFGAASDVRPNPLVADSAESNTQIISMNNSVRGQLCGGDVRRNYFMLGATWTQRGFPPLPGCENVAGASQLANSTMESFTQVNDFFSPCNSCFFCHKANTAAVSRIFNDLEGLP